MHTNISDLQPFRRLFDNSQIGTAERQSVNEFVFRCLNEEGLPLCIRQALTHTKPELKHFRTRYANLGGLPADKIFPTNLTADIEYYDTGEDGLVHVDCIVDEPLGKTVAEHFRHKKNSQWERMCKTIGIKKDDAADMPYSMLHRVYQLIALATDDTPEYNEEEDLLERGLFYEHVIWAVQSFGKHKQFDQFAAFTEALGIPLEERGVLSKPKEITFTQDDHRTPDCDQSLNFYMVWVNDQTFPGLDS